MHPVSRVHMLHRFLRYRYRTERASLGYVMREVPRGGTALDVGANRGIYSYWLSRRVGPAGRVVGFEPQPDTAAATRRTMQAFGCRNVRIESLAVGETAGTATLRRRGEGDGSARLDGAGAGPAVDAATMEAVTVPVVALDA